MLTQLPHLPAASANAPTGTRTLGAASLAGKPAHRVVTNEPHAHCDQKSPAGTDNGNGHERVSAIHPCPAESATLHPFQRPQVTV
jgi:hypothetical protein